MHSVRELPFFLTKTTIFRAKDRMPPNEGHDTGDPSWELTMTMVQQALAENDEDDEEEHQGNMI